MKVPIIKWVELNNSNEVISNIRHIIGWSDKEDLLFTAARDGFGNGYILEIGAGTGYSTVALAAGSKIAKRETVFSMDWDIGYGEDFFIESHRRSNGRLRWDLLCDNLIYCGVHDWVVLFRSASYEAHKWFNLPLRLLFIDSTHDLELVKLEIEKYGRLLISGGLIYLHDYHNNLPLDDYSHIVAQILQKEFANFTIWDNCGGKDTLMVSAIKL